MAPENTRKPFFLCFQGVKNENWPEMGFGNYNKLHLLLCQESAIVINIYYLKKYRNNAVLIKLLSVDPVTFFFALNLASTLRKSRKICSWSS